MAKSVPELVGDLTELWLKWMLLNKRTMDASLPWAERRKSAEEQECLTKERYAIIDEIDKHFDIVPPKKGDQE